MIGGAVMSSQRHDWQTPDAILDAVRKVAPIGLDPCTVASNPTDSCIALPASRTDTRWFHDAMATADVM